VSPEFVPALELNAGFYRDVVEPLVRPWRHSAALVGDGSELLGFDTERSTDHGWGPRLQVFVDAADVAAARAAVDAGLPTEYRSLSRRSRTGCAAGSHAIRSKACRRSTG
jgi:hypothetical protein